jgi:hypothetical protein
MIQTSTEQIMSTKKRTVLIILIIIAVSAAVLLTAGITPDTELRPGTTFYSDDETEPAEAIGTTQVVPKKIYEIPVLLIILLVLIPTILFILILIFVPKARGRAIRNFIMILMWMGFLYALNRFSRQEPVEESEEIVTETIVNSFSPLQQDIAPLPVFQAETPDWDVYLNSFIVVLIIIGVTGFFYWRSRQSDSDDELDMLAEEAKSAIVDIQSGGDFRNAILRCYSQMCQILQKERGIYRSDWMTPREFERRMLRAGVPHKPAQGLTKLFEFVRYGGKTPDSEQENQAVLWLNAIAAESEKS